MPKKLSSPKTARSLKLWYNATVHALNDLPFDLSARQMAVLLHIYVTPPPHSIKSLAKQLSFSKAAACRAVDVLEYARLVKRDVDRRDGRNVLLKHTVKGANYLSGFAEIISRSQKAI